MSSFRVKTTHTLLKTEGESNAETSKNSSSNILMFNDDKNLLNVKYEKSASDRPKDSSSKGLAIRTVMTGQPDHM